MTIVRREYDVLVVGSGAAGSAAAQTAAASGAKVLLISKDPMVCSDSKISEGIVTVQGVASRSDSPAELASNMRIQGDDLADEALTGAFARDSAQAYQWLRDNGLTPDINPETGQPVTVPVPMGGHTKVRSVLHVNGGLAYGHALWNSIMQEGNIDHVEDAWLLDLYVNEGERSGEREILGALIYHAAKGGFISVKAPSVVLACGGLSTIYFPHTDTMKGNCGDAYAIAARAGAQLVDMEQVQFLPFAVTNSPSYMGLPLGEPVSVGPGGVIRDKDGVILQSEVMVHTRAHCAAVIAKAVAEGRGTENDGCYLDMTESAKGKSGAMFVQMMSERGEHMISLLKRVAGAKASRFEEPFEVAPSAHYHMGGVRVNEQSEALLDSGRALKGLTAAGQAMGGLHGSNRLGSTSLAEGAIFGRRAGSSALRRCASRPDYPWSCVEEQETRLVAGYQAKLGQGKAGKTTSYPIHIIRALQGGCWQGIGPARTEQGIVRLLAEIRTLESDLDEVTVEDGLGWNQSFIDYIECVNMLQCARFVAESSLFRKHSVGAHVRLDEAALDRKKAPYSIACEYQATPSGTYAVALTMIARESSPLSDKIRLMIGQAIRAHFIKAMRVLPLAIRDFFLLRIYRKLQADSV